MNGQITLREFLSIRLDRYRNAKRSSIVYAAVGLLLVSFLTLSFHWTWFFLLLAPVFASMLKGDRVVLWLRRFHQDDPDRYPFHRALIANSRLLGAVPVTPQDSRFTHSSAAALGRAGILVELVKAGILGAVKVGIPALLLAIGAFYLFGGESMPGEGLSFGVVVILTILLLGTLGGVAMSLLSMRRKLVSQGFVPLDDVNTERRADAVYRRIRAGEVYSNGIEVLRCGEKSWQEIVLRGMRQASAVIIDVTDPSDWVMWELETAFRVVGDRVILVHRDADGDLPEETLAWLREKLTEDDIGKAEVVAYRGGDSRPGEVRETVNRELLSALGSCFTRNAEPKRDGTLWRGSLRLWRRSLTWLLAVGSLVALILVAYARQAGDFAADGGLSSASAMQPLLVLLGLVHVLSAVRLLGYLRTWGSRRALRAVFLVFLAGYLSVFAVRSIYAYAKIRRGLQRFPLTGMLAESSSPVERMTELLNVEGESGQKLLEDAEKVMKHETEEVLVNLDDALANTSEETMAKTMSELYREAMEDQERIYRELNQKLPDDQKVEMPEMVEHDFDSIAASQMAAMAKVREQLSVFLGPAAEADEESEPGEGDPPSEPVSSPPEDLQLGQEFWGYDEEETEAPTPPKLTFMQKLIARLGGDINLALHYVGLAGLIQALISWRTNRGLRSARRIAREMSKA